MRKVREIYRCPVCGNLVEVLNGGAGELVCCGKPMVLLAENDTDAAMEKHVPVVEYRVKVGSVEHPMVEGHYIHGLSCRQAGR